MRATDFINEALRPSQYRRYVKGWDKSRYNKIFGDKYRIYLPLQKSTEGIEPNKTVVDVLESLGYTVTVEDYMAGYATKSNRKFKIGRILTNQYVGNEEMQDRIIALFVNDPARAGRAGNLLVVISRHPYDIAGMSTDRGWSSCMNIDSGAMRQYVQSDVVYGTLVAYLIKSNDTNITNPIARVLIKPFVNTKDTTNVIFGVENRVYGTAPKEFAQTVVQWANAINSSKVLTGLFKMPWDMYRDDIIPNKWYGSEDEQQQIEAVALDPDYLKDIPNPSDTVVRTALKRSPAAIRHVKNPDPAQIEWALRADGSTIIYINNPTEEQMRIAITSNPASIEYIENPDENLQRLAVTIRPAAIRHIKDPTDDVKKTAVSKQPSVIQHIKNPSEKLQLLAIEQGDEQALNYINAATDNTSRRVMLAALQKYPMAIRYITNPSLAMQAYAVKKDPHAIRWISNPSETTQLLAVRQDGFAIRNIYDPTERVQLAAIRNSRHAYGSIDLMHRTPAAYELFKKLWPKHYRSLRNAGWVPSRVDFEIGNIKKGKIYEGQSSKKIAADAKAKLDAIICEFKDFTNNES